MKVNVKEHARQLCNTVREQQSLARDERRRKHREALNHVNAVLNIVRKDHLKHEQLRERKLPLPQGVQLSETSTKAKANLKQLPWEDIYKYPSTKLSENNTSHKLNSSSQTHMKDDSDSKFPNPRVHASRALSIDALKQEAELNPWMRGSYHLRIGQRYAELYEYGRALRYYLLALEERADFDAQHQLLERERKTSKNDCEGMLEDAVYHQRQVIRTKQIAKEPLSLREKTWSAKFEEYAASRKEHVLRRHSMAHHGCFEIHLREFYESHLLPNADVCGKAGKHIRAWLDIQRPVDVMQQRTLARNSNAKRKRKPSKQLKRRSGRLNSRTSTSMREFCSNLIEIHDSLSAIENATGPRSAEDQGAVAMNQSIGAVGDVHIDVLKELVQLLDLPSSTQQRWSLKPNETTEPLEKLDSLSPNAVVKNQVCSYFAIDLWFKLGELFVERLEYTNARAMFARVSHHRVAPPALGHQPKLNNANDDQEMTSSCHTGQVTSRPSKKSHHQSDTSAQPTENRSTGLNQNTAATSDHTISTVQNTTNEVSFSNSECYNETSGVLDQPSINEIVKDKNRYAQYSQKGIPTEPHRCDFEGIPVSSLRQRIRHLYFPACVSNQIVNTSVVEGPSTMWSSTSGARSSWHNQSPSLAKKSIVPLQVPARLCAKIQLAADDTPMKDELQKRALPFAVVPQPCDYNRKEVLGTFGTRYFRANRGNLVALWQTPTTDNMSSHGRARIAQFREPILWSEKTPSNEQVVHRHNLSVATDHEKELYKRQLEQQQMVGAEIESAQARNLRSIQDDAVQCDQANHTTALLSNVPPHAPPDDIPLSHALKKHSHKNAFTLIM